MDSILRQNAQKGKEIPHTWEYVRDEYNPVPIETPEPPVGGGDGSQEEVKKKKSFFFIFFILAFVVFFIAMIFAIWQWSSSKNAISTTNIAISPTLIEYAPSGEILNQNLSVSNNNAVAIDNVVVAVDYVRGQDYQGNQDRVRNEYRFGTLAPGAYIATTTPFVFFGQEGDTRAVSYEMTYTVAGSNTTFSKAPVKKNVTISAPAVTLTVTGADQIIDNHEYAFTIAVRNVNQENFTPSILTVEVPTGFKIGVTGGMTGAPNVFKIDTLPIGTEKTFAIVGKFENAVNAQRYFRIYLSTQKGNEVGNTFANAEKAVSILPEPVAVTLSPLQNTTPLQAEAVVTNNSNAAIDNVVVTMKSSTGEEFTLNSTTHPDLMRLAPNSSARLRFNPTNVTSGSMRYSIKVYGVQRNLSFDTVLLRQVDLPISFR